MALAVSGDGRLIATADINSGTVSVHERDTGRLALALDSDGVSVAAVAFSPDGRLMVTAESSQGWRGIALWDLATRRRLRKFEEAAGCRCSALTGDC
jgi:WD40 repeat protein